MKFKFCGNIDCPDWWITEIIFLTKISSVKLRIWCNQMCTFIISKGKNFKDVSNILEEMGFSSQESTIIISVLEFILKNSSKFDVDDLALNQELQQLGLPQENADSISKVYKNKKEILRTNLMNQIFGFNVIKDVNYKISYNLGNQYSQFAFENEKEDNWMEDNYQITSIDKTRINLCFSVNENNEKKTWTTDKETLGKLIGELERCSEIIKKYKEQA